MPQIPPPKRHPYDQWSPDARALDLVGDKWTLLIVRDLAAGPRRFVELQRVLPGISTEQLRSRLNRMVADGLLTRKRYREVPPRVDYELTVRSLDLLPVLGALAAWGYRWAWGRPRPGEAVDIGAILRLAPGLVTAQGHHGAVECAITDGHRGGGQLTLTIVLGRGATQVHEAPAAAADAQIGGDKPAWIAALSPDGSADGLRIAGDRDLATHVLSALAGASRLAAGTAERAPA